MFVFLHLPACGDFTIIGALPIPVKNQMIKTCCLFAVLLCSPLWAKTPASYANQMASWSQHQRMLDNSPWRGLEWRSVGPVFQGGRVVAVATPAGAENPIYVAYASGGVWKSSNNGQTFMPLTDHLPTQVVGALSVDPNNPDVLWLGSGENNSSRSSYGGMGVFKSSDGGRSWQHSGLGDSDRIGRIVVDPNDSNVIYVAVLGRLYTRGGERGVYKSSDGGQSWRRVLDGDDHTGFVDLSLNTEGVLFATAWQRLRRAWDFQEAGSGSAVYRSRDNGESWQRLQNGLPVGVHVGRMGVATTPADANVVYVAVDNQTPLPPSEWDLGDQAVTVKRLQRMSTDEFLLQDPAAIERFLRAQNFPPEDTAEHVIEEIKAERMAVADLVSRIQDANANLFNSDIRSLEVYRSDDGGDSFRRTHSEDLQNVVYTYGYYFGQVRVDPSDADVVYTMGVPLIKSEDGGATWHSIWQDGVHVDYHELWINPNNPSHLITGNDGGLDVSYDGGANWRKMDRQPVGQFYTVAVDMATPYNIYGGLQDNGTVKGSSRSDWTRGESWKSLFGGDGMHVNVDDAQKITYVGFQFGNYYKLGSSGPESIKPPSYLDEEALRLNWNSPVMLSSHNPDILYYGAHRLYRSLNQGADWRAISGDLTESEQRGDVPYATITSISESPRVFGQLWVGTDDGLVWVSEDGGSEWRKAVRGLPKHQWVSRVIASQHDDRRVWLTLNNYRNDDIEAQVYRSDNLGRKWHRIDGGLPAEAVNVIKEDPHRDDTVYLGTDKGVYVSRDRGQNWQVLGGNLPTVPVHDLVVHPRDHELVAATHGRSVWVADLTALQTPLPDEHTGLFVYPLEPVQFKASWRGRPSRWFTQPGQADSLTVQLWSDGAGPGTVVLSDEAGHRVLEAPLTLVHGVNRWDWDLLVDQTLALQAEDARVAEMEAPVNLKHRPYAEAVRLGHRLYVQPGKYTLEVQRGDDSHRIEWQVKAPD